MTKRWKPLGLEMPDGFKLSQWAAFSNPGSLTQHFNTISSGKVQLQCHKRTWESALPEEMDRLHLSTSQKRVWVREITHEYQQQSWVWGRTIIPHRTLEATHINGNTTESIGISLFKHSNFKRSDFEYCQINDSHPYFQSIAHFISKPIDCLWARRSLFSMQNHSLLVVEVFIKDDIG